ncbi:MAG: adenylate/guanylate cyclase domain-containing protein, partial [Microbacterium sp.]
LTAAALVPRLLLDIDPDAVDLRIEGTAVLIDISGFTVLSEQLAAAGREGTEQLIATLSRIFTVLLPVTDDGGDVVKFAGDALFILFTGPEHARHAAHAAWNMNRVLQAIGDIHLPSARARLRMSVGVHSGTYEVLLTGTENVSAILTGAATSRVIELQNAAEAGRILVSDETAAALPPKQVAPSAEVPGAHRLLRAGSVATASLMALSAGRTEAADRFLPRAFAERRDLLGSEPDHRWAAIGFVQVSGVPDEPGAGDLERMSRLTALVEQIAAETGVTLLDVDPAIGGYRYFLTAGAPTAVEDPEGRLITASLRLVTADSGYALRAGVTSGRVFAGFVGAHFRQTYTVMGDPTNLAARLTSRAEPGTVLVARGVLERTTRPFQTADAGTISVKGKTQGIPVAVVTDEGSADGIETRAPFIGRDAELTLLRGLLARAVEGEGSTLVLTGPAGIGKSRLIARAIDQTPLPVLRAHGDRYGASTPYRTLQSLLRPLLGIPASASAATAGERLSEVVEEHRPDLRPWLALIAPAVRAEASVSTDVDALDDAFRAERTTQVLHDFIVSIADGPRCLIIDDAQWVDPASAGVLAEIAAGDTTHAILVARRDEAGGFDPDGEHLALEGLPDDDAGDLIEAIAGRRMLPADLQPLLSRAEGNPLYLVELASSLDADGDALGVEQLIGERIDGLSETDRTTLRRAAVLGVRIPLGLYLKCVGAPLLSSGLSAFLELGVDAISFRSELFRDVAYDQLTFQSRRELHRAAAAAIAADPLLGGMSRDAMLTVHYEAAGEWDAARDTAARAAASAEKAFALEEAVRSYRVAVEAARRSAGSSDDLPDLLQALGRVSVAGGWAAEGLEAYSSARKLITDAVERATIDRERAYALNVLGRPDEAVRALRAARRGIAGLGDESARVLAAVAVTEAGLRLRQGRWTVARDLAIEAIGLLEDHADDPTQQRVLADAYRYHDIAASELEGDAGMLHLAEALALYDKAGDELSKSKVLSLLGVRAYYRGDWGMAATLYGQSHAAAEAAGDVVGGAIEGANAAEILLEQGELAQARPLLRKARRVFEASDNPYLVAYVLILLGRAELRAGDPAAACEHFTASAEGYAALDEAEDTAEARVRLAEAHLAAGDLPAAEDVVASLADAPISGLALSRLERQRARIAAAHGRDDDALAAARAAVTTPDSTPLERALSLALVAQLSPDDTVTAEARELLRGLGVIDIDTLLAAEAGILSPLERP